MFKSLQQHICGGGGGGTRLLPSPLAVTASNAFQGRHVYLELFQDHQGSVYLDKCVLKHI